MTRLAKNSYKTVNVARALWKKWHRSAEATCLQEQYFLIETQRTGLSCCDNMRHLLLTHYLPRYQSNGPVIPPDHNAQQIVTRWSCIFFSSVISGSSEP